MAEQTQAYAKGLPLPLTLQIETRSVSFPSMDDFEFALSGRTEVPWTRVKKSLKLSDSELKREAEGIKRVEKQFVDALSDSLADETTMGRHFRGMDIKLFSQDHQWRAIISAINELDGRYDGFKRIALVKYMQYLTSRQEVVQGIYTERQAQRSAAEDAEREGQASQDPALRDTVLFDLSRLETKQKKSEKFVRLPKGEAIDIPLSEGEGVAVLLAKHRFSLVSGSPSYLVDENGVDYLLHQGKNFVGRDAASDISVNPAYRDVSRKHLIIEVESSTLTHLTDLSSHGTFVAPEYLDSTQV